MLHKTFKAEVERICPKCNDWGGERIVCHDACRGYTIDCSTCKGTGKVTEIVKITIPPFKEK